MQKDALPNSSSGNSAEPLSTVTRPRDPAARVTIQNIVDWQSIRLQHDARAMDINHNYLHLGKVLGMIAALLEHRDHGEPEPVIEDKRLADLIIHSIWIANAMGYDPAKIVAHRCWELGIGPIRGELPPSERGQDGEEKNGAAACDTMPS